MLVCQPSRTVWSLARSLAAGVVGILGIVGFWGGLAACNGPRLTPGLDGVIELDGRGLGFEFGGRLDSLRVSRGARVHKGEELCHLDDTLDRMTRPIRQAEVAAAEARLALLVAGARATDLRALGDQVQAANAQVEAAERELARQEALYQRGAGTRMLVDDLTTRVKLSRADRDAATQRLSTLRQGSRAQEITAAEASRDGARAALSALDERLRRYTLRAPEDGVVLDAPIRPGEVLPAGGTAILFAEPKQPYVDVFVPVPRLAGVQVGGAATLHADGDPRAYGGRVEHISPTTEYTPRYLLSETDRATLMTRVRVRLQDPEEQLHAGVPCRVVLPGEGGGSR